MITDKVYIDYFQHLMEGQKEDCQTIISRLLEADVAIGDLYLELLQKSLYDVGDLWEANKIGVAKEHLVTAITEGLLNLVFPRICSLGKMRTGKVAVISCTPNEYHQVGGKMIADILELHGWDSHFLGANTPEKYMLEYIDEVQPDLVGLSASIYFNIAALQQIVHKVRSNFSHLDILVGGQAFRWGGTDIFSGIPGVEHFTSLKELEKSLEVGRHGR